MEINRTMNEGAPTAGPTGEPLCGNSDLGSVGGERPAGVGAGSGAGIYSVLLGERSFEARIEKSGEGWVVTIGGRRYVLEVSDPRRLKRRREAVYGEGRRWGSAGRGRQSGGVDVRR